MFWFAELFCAAFGALDVVLLDLLLELFEGEFFCFCVCDVCLFSEQVICSEFFVAFLAFDHGFFEMLQVS